MNVLDCTLKASHSCTITVTLWVQSLSTVLVSFSGNATEVDIHLDSNTVAENASAGTVIGKLSRKPSLPREEITFLILKDEDEEQPFEIDGNILKLKFGVGLDYERLPADKTIPVIISSVPSKSAVFTKHFLIKILGEMCTLIWL